MLESLKKMNMTPEFIELKNTEATIVKGGSTCGHGFSKVEICFS